MLTSTLVICPVFPSRFCRSLHFGFRAFALATPLPLHPAAGVILIQHKLDHGVPLLKMFQWCPLSLESKPRRPCQWPTRPDLLWFAAPCLIFSLPALLTWPQPRWLFCLSTNVPDLPLPQDRPLHLLFPLCGILSSQIGFSLLLLSSLEGPPYR